MVELLLVLVVVGFVVSIALLVTVLRKAAANDPARLSVRFDALERASERNERALRDELDKLRAHGAEQARAQRDEIAAQVQRMSNANEQRMVELRQSVEQKLTLLQQDNAKKLDQMRATVDEKLQSVLEKRLGDSFKMVSERLQKVHEGLGEMRTLASGVGDLKKVLTNVKTRGIWGEVQLGNLLEQLLTPDQYARDVATKPRSPQRVEFAIKLPGQDGVDGEPVLLPIDAKFPQEDYQRLVEASEAGNLEAVEVASRALEARVVESARSIRDKYINPPHTTNFALMFLPTEGLYAEIVRNPGLVDRLQREFRVVPTGPTVLSALLNSLQMGFRTLAIEKRSSEVWNVLGAVKAEFGKFGDVLARVKDKLDQASKTIEDEVGQRTRVINRKLKDVQELPASARPPLLIDADDNAGDET